MKKKILIALSLTALLLSVAALLILQPWASGLTTEIAVLFTAEQIETVEGVFVRSEQRVEISGGSSVLYLPADGERVAKYGLLAKIYSDSEDAESSREIDELKDELSALKAVSASAGFNSASALTLQAIENQVDAKLTKLGSFGQGSDMTGLFELRSGLTELLNKRHVNVGDQTDFSSRITLLEKQIAALKSSMGSFKEVTAPLSGYFFSYSDGLESIKPAQLKKITPKKVDDLIEQSGSAKLTNIGKLVTEYRWYYAFTLPSDKSVRLAGAEVSVRFPALSGNKLSAQLTQLVKPETGSGEDRAAGVLTSIDATSELCESRIQTAELIIESHTGIKISSKAIRTVLVEGQEQQGVYVLKGTRLSFKQIQPMTVYGDYTLCEDTKKSGWLTLYDQVVTGGKDLYDGKVVR